MSTQLTAVKSRIEDSRTQEKFVNVFAARNGVSKTIASEMYEVEKMHFMTQIASIKPCSMVSTLQCFLEVVGNGLSFNQTNKHVYLMPRGERLTYQVTADGMIYQAKKAGSLDRVTKPVIVYDCDDLRREYVDGELKISYSPADRTGSEKIVGGFVYLIHQDGTREGVYMDYPMIDRLAGYSAKQNRGKANALYTSNNGQIDEGFFQTKLIKYALKNVRKNGSVGSNEVNEEGIFLQGGYEVADDDDIDGVNIEI